MIVILINEVGKKSYIIQSSCKYSLYCPGVLLSLLYKVNPAPNIKEGVLSCKWWKKCCLCIVTRELSMVWKIFITEGAPSLCIYVLQNFPLSINCFFSYKFPVTTKQSCQIAFSGFDMMPSRGRENAENYSAANLKITIVLTYPHS